MTDTVSADEAAEQGTSPTRAFRMAAFDLDGTLLGADAKVTGSSIAVLRRVAARGVHLVAATGRSHFTAGPRLAVTQAVEWAVCSNGATLYHVPSDTVVEYRTIADDDLVDLIDAVRTALPDAAFGWEAVGSYQWTAGFEAAIGDSTSPRHVVPDDTPLPPDVIKLFVGHRSVIRYDLLETLLPVVPDGLNLSTAGMVYLEATGRGVNKATGLARLCERLDVDASEVLAFGDNMNDLEMLTWAGRGYAMANAHREVVAAATHRTRLPCTQDGVADTLAELFLG